MQSGQELEWLRAARSAGLLSQLPDRLVENLLMGSYRVEYRAGEVGLRWEEEPSTAFVLRGSMRTFLMFPDGGQATVRYLKPGDMTGVFAPRTPRIARAVQALEPAELLFVDGARVKELALAEPAFAWAMIEEMATVLNGAHRALYIRAYGSVRQRVASALLDRAAIAGPATVGTCVSGTQGELATAVGSVREVVASALQALKREGVIDVLRGRIVVLDPVRLADEANLGLS